MKRTGLYLGIITVIATGCASDKPEGAGKETKSQAAQASVKANTSATSDQPQKAVAIDTMQSNISASQDQINRDHQAAEKEKDRKAEAAENEARRKQEMIMADKRNAGRDKRDFMDTLVGLTYIKTMADMAHPNGCVGKGMVAGLKETADALRNALSTTDVAEGKKPGDAKEAKADAPASGAPASAQPAATPAEETHRVTTTYQLKPEFEQMYPKDFVGPVPEDAYNKVETVEEV